MLEDLAGVNLHKNGQLVLQYFSTLVLLAVHHFTFVKEVESTTAMCPTAGLAWELARSELNRNVVDFDLEKGVTQRECSSLEELKEAI